MEKKINNIKVKSVSYNISDPYQKMLWEKANEQTNFSAYIKRIQQRDIEGGNFKLDKDETPTEEHEFSVESFI